MKEFHSPAQDKRSYNPHEDLLTDLERLVFMLARYVREPRHHTTNAIHLQLLLVMEYNYPDRLHLMESFNRLGRFYSNQQ